MNPIKDLFAPKTPQNHSRSEWNELIGYFHEKLNKNRLKTKYKPLTPSRVAKMFEGMKVKDLRYCESYFKDLERDKGLSAACKWLQWSVKSSG